MGEVIAQIMGNKIIQTGAVAWVVSQILKTILHLIVNKKIVWERLVGDGGMPSSHSATVTSVAVATGFAAGFDSAVFAVAVFLAIIVMHDARGVRRETGKQAVVINDMLELFEQMGAGTLTPEQTLKEFVGHSPLQVAAGAILGFVVAILPHKMDNQFKQDMVPEADSPVFLFTEDQTQYIMAHVSSGRMRYPLYRELPEGIRYTYLFSIDDDKYFMGIPEDPANFKAPDGLTKLGIRQLRMDYYNGDENRHLIFAAYTAGQLAAWYRDNRYCGNCGRTIYPRILPAVIIAVTDGDRIILTKYAGRAIPFYALVAGFNEIGESFEETVKREVMEEVGLKVKNIRYYKSQPWGIVDDILAGYYCDVDGSTEIRMDRTELKEAVWVERKDVEGQPHDLSLTNEMMVTFREGREPLGYRYADDKI